MTSGMDTSKTLFIEHYRLQSLSREKQDELFALWEEALRCRVLQETLERLGDAGRLEYERLLDREATETDIRKFFNDTIAGYQRFVREIQENFEQELQPGIL